MSVWDDPAVRPDGDYVKFDEPGDHIVGEVLAVGLHQFDDGKIVPKITLRTGDGAERTLTAGQVRLKAALAEQRPEVGDRLSVRLDRIEPRPGGKSLKHFDVTVTRAGATGSAGQATPVVPQQRTPDGEPPPPAAVLDALPPQTRAMFEQLLADKNKTENQQDT